MKSMSIGTKLIGGFLIVAVITLVVGFTGWYGAKYLEDHMDELGDKALPSIQHVLTAAKALHQVESAVRGFLNPGITSENRQALRQELSEARESYKRALDAYQGITKPPEQETAMKGLLQAIGGLKKENEFVVQTANDLEKMGVGDPLLLKANIEKFTGDHWRLLALTAELLLSQEEFEGGEDHTQCAFGKWMAGYKTTNSKISEALNQVKDSHAKFHQSVKKIKELCKKGDLEQAKGAYQKEMMGAAKVTFEKFQAIRDETALAGYLFHKMDEHAMGTGMKMQKEVESIMDKTAELEKEKAQATMREADAAASRIRLISLVGMTGGFLLVVVLGILATRTVVRTIRRVVDGLSEASEQLAAASGQVASSSQQLAEGASEQAAAIEETSSSMEEMASMTRQNACNATQANQLMKDANKVAGQANQSMNHVNASMSQISKASEETQKIIRTIDEIAFQTNLLALNAAVEAARAGEAGAGFAVVADEVRNLAMRAADAAKNTASLIEATVRRVKEGAELVDKTNREFREVESGMTKASVLVGEIAAASQEQAQGIEQVNRAITEMDKVVQQNAANAEESASASEEMTAQAEQMKDYVGELTALVGGKGEGSERLSSAGIRRKISNRAVRRTPHKAATTKQTHSGKGNGKALPVAAGKGGEVRPEQVIPLSEEEFGDF